MNLTKSLITLQRLYQRINGSTIIYDLNEYTNTVQTIIHKANEIQSRPDAALQQEAQNLRRLLQQQATFDDVLIDAYALVCEASRRILGLQPFAIQIIGALALHDGKLAEMPTGEGKTLMAVFPAFLHAFSGQGVHVLTFNDYLARRDAEWMGPLYRYLGLDVGYVQEGMSCAERKTAYAVDVTYLTAKEAGFDFLRDSLCADCSDRVQRPFNFAIVDEADSILIDEARIPLVLAGSFDEHAPETFQLAEIVRQLDSDQDIEFDEYRRSVALSDSGLRRVETLLACDNLFAAEHAGLLARIHCALHAEFLLQRDVDYLVRQGRIELIDEFTGRIADKRRWPDGLQAALEAKEQLSSQRGGMILNSINLHHFLQRYSKLCGMTATAQSAAEEFRRFYHLDVVVIPPHVPCCRHDLPDVVFNTLEEKYRAVLDEIVAVNHAGQPVLVGTCSVEESVVLARALRARGVPCHVLNAKHDEQEARIIAQAGKPGAVTISTNMAGRGTDIRLGGADEARKAEVLATGGLYVIGLNRHESWRIDMQLRGRAGRQRDPGSSRFFISLEDELFVKYRLADLLPHDADENTKAREIERIQRIIEGQNLEIKKTLSRYSSLIEQQRRILFNWREQWLEADACLKFFETAIPDEFNACRTASSDEQAIRVGRRILLHAVDSRWIEYLAEIADIREGIHLHRIGGQDPYLEFQKFAVTRFDALLDEVEEHAIRLFLMLQEDEQKEPALKTPSASWTYLVNDDPFEHRIVAESFQNVGFASGAAFMWPLTMLLFLVKKFRGKITSPGGRG